MVMPTTMATVLCTVPPGAAGGMPVVVQTASGPITVLVPPGLAPGMQFQVQMPAAAPPPIPMATPVEMATIGITIGEVSDEAKAKAAPPMTGTIEEAEEKARNEAEARREAEERTAADTIEFVGLWNDSPSRAFSGGSHRVRYEYLCDAAAYNNGWTVEPQDFATDVRGFVARMRAAGVTTAFWAIQDGNEIYSSLSAGIEWQRHGRASRLEHTTVPERSSDSYGLVLPDFAAADGSPARIDHKGGAWQNAVYKITLSVIPMGTEAQKPETGLFAGSRIEARYNQGTPMEVKRSNFWYPGIVKRVHGGGAFGSANYDVRFDDGVNEDGIPAEHIRKAGSGGDGDDVLPGLGGPDMPAPVHGSIQR